MSKKKNVKYVEEEISKKHGPETEKGAWKIRTNQEVTKLFQKLNLTADTERRK